MKKVICDKTICFFDDENKEIMYFDYSTDECIIGINTSEKITISKDMELYSLLEDFMNQNYVFPKEELQNEKSDKKLTWYSDCYYNPDDKLSISSVSCLNIEKKEDCFEIWCTKKIDEILQIKTKRYVVAFSPCGNGNYSRNKETGLTLQDDFIKYIYHPLLNKNKVLRIKI